MMRCVARVVGRSAAIHERYIPAGGLSILSPLIHHAFPVTRPFSSNSSGSDKSPTSTADDDALDESNSDTASPSTARSFRNYVRQRSSNLAARATASAAAVAGGAQREWRDTPQMRALKQEALGGVIRHTKARIQPERMDEFITWAEQHLSKAYPHPGFKGLRLSVNREESQSAHATCGGTTLQLDRTHMQSMLLLILDTVENLTFWKSELAVSQNSHLPAYRSTMMQLAEFCIGTPVVEVKQVVLEVNGPIGGGATEEEIAEATRKNPPATPISRENASGIDYSS